MFQKKTFSLTHRMRDLRRRRGVQIALKKGNLNYATVRRAWGSGHAFLTGGGAGIVPHQKKTWASGEGLKTKRGYRGAFELVTAVLYRKVR